MKEQLIFYGEFKGIKNLYVKKKIYDLDHALDILKFMRTCHWRINAAYYVNPHKVSFRIPLSSAIDIGVI